MDVFRLLKAGLFIYENLRLLLLVILMYIASMGGSFNVESYMLGAFFPYFVYLSANALFPLMALFIWLKPMEYRNYLTLYLAGKIIAVVSFFVWEFFASREMPGVENMAKSSTLFGGSILLSLLDIFSIAGAWGIKNRMSRDSQLSGGV